MPNRYKNIDFVKTFASIPPDIIDLMQKSGDFGAKAPRKPMIISE